MAVLLIFTELSAILRRTNNMFNNIIIDSKNYIHWFTLLPISVCLFSLLCAVATYIMVPLSLWVVGVAGSFVPIALVSMGSV